MQNEKETIQKREVYATLPLVYSCSGCSSAAQLANKLAIRLDREKFAEMSCIAGIGGNVTSLVKLAKSGRKILALDGCALHCVKQVLRVQGITTTIHINLSDLGVKKRFHADASPQEETHAWEIAVLPAVKKIS